MKPKQRIDWASQSIKQIQDESAKYKISKTNKESDAWKEVKTKNQIRMLVIQGETGLEGMIRFQKA